jgi:hypothetical protein
VGIKIVSPVFLEIAILLLRSTYRVPLVEATMFIFFGDLPVMDKLFQVTNPNKIRPSVRALARLPSIRPYTMSVNGLYTFGDKIRENHYQGKVKFSEISKLAVYLHITYLYRQAPQFSETMYVSHREEHLVD